MLWLGAALVGLHVSFPYMNMLIDLKVNHIKLLEILPAMHKELLEYPESFAQLDRPGIPSLGFAWLNPFDKDSSPYGVDVSNSLVEAIHSSDIYLLDKYLRELCSMLAVILQRQRGNAYGFGLVPDSSEHVLKQLSKEKLEDAPTHTKAVENLYGVEDMILSRFGPQSFERSQDDLVIRYSSDLLDQSHVWSSKRMRKLAKKMDKTQKQFTTEQKRLVSSGVKPAEAILLTNENKIQRVVEQCRQLHGGPISKEEELDDLLERFKDDGENLQKALILEIRYQKFTYLNVKDSNPLFAQLKLSREQLVTNLRLLIKNCALSLKAAVTIDDLKMAIEKPANLSESGAESLPSDTPLEIISPIPQVVVGLPVRNITSIGPVLWPPKLQDHLIANFEDGYRICEVIKVNKQNEVRAELMKPKPIKTAPLAKEREFWVRPVNQSRVWLNPESILPIYPVLEVAVPPSTNKCIVHQLINVDIVEKLAEL